MKAYMKIARLCACITLFASLAACGNSSPSESDARHAIEARFGDCPYVTITDFRKTNGIPGDDPNSYRVEVAYTVKVDPKDDDLREALKAYAQGYAELQSVTADIKQKEAQYSDEAKAYADAHKDDPGAPSESDLFFQKNAEAENSDQQLLDERKRQMELSAMINLHEAPIAFHNKIYSACRGVPQNVINPFFMNGTIGQLADGMSKDFTGTFYMVKTDNGWQMAR